MLLVKCSVNYFLQLYFMLEYVLYWGLLIPINKNTECRRYWVVFFGGTCRYL
jgi:hypothetical protein